MAVHEHSWWCLEGSEGFALERRYLRWYDCISVVVVASSTPNTTNAAKDVILVWNHLEFPTKIGTGMGEQMLSREYYYMGTQLPIDRFLTFTMAIPVSTSTTCCHSFGPVFIVTSKYV
jgi:hypothetical protein